MVLGCQPVPLTYPGLCELILRCVWHSLQPGSQRTALETEARSCHSPPSYRKPKSSLAAPFVLTPPGSPPSLHPAAQMPAGPETGQACACLTKLRWMKGIRGGGIYQNGKKISHKNYNPKHAHTMGREPDLYIPNVLQKSSAKKLT